MAPFKALVSVSFNSVYFSQLCYHHACLYPPDACS